MDRQTCLLARMSAEPLTLAPAAGTGIGKMLADALLATDGFAELMADVVRRGLVAETRRWDPAAKDWCVEPDMRSQLQTLTLVLAHMEGEPIKRIIHQHLGNGGTIDPLAALQDSPALRDAARRLLEKSEFKDRHKRSKAEKRVEAVEV